MSHIQISRFPQRQKKQRKGNHQQIILIFQNQRTLYSAQSLQRNFFQGDFQKTRKYPICLKKKKSVSKSRVRKFCTSMAILKTRKHRKLFTIQNSVSKLSIKYKDRICHRRREVKSLQHVKEERSQDDSCTQKVEGNKFILKNIKIL